MSLLEDIQQSTSDANIPLSAVLRKCAILAHRLQHDELRKWVDQELNGYQSEESLPDYRRLSVQSRGHFVGFGGAQIRNQPIPSYVWPKEIRETANQVSLTDGVATYEQLLADSRDASFKVDWPPELVALVQDKIIDGYVCMSAWRQITRGQVVNLLDTVRNKVLEFTLRLEEDFPEESARDFREHDIPAERVDQTFHTTIQAVTAQVAIASPGATISQVIKDDFRSLASYVQSLGIAESDTAELERAIREDPIPKDPHAFGKRVSRWIGDMVEKAAQGAIGASAVTVAQALSSAILKYYGLV